MARPRKPKGAQASAPPGCPEQPSGLSDAAAEEWGMLIAELTELGTLSTVDRAAIEMAARYGALFYAADAQVERDGIVVASKSGTKLNPALRARDDAARIRKLYLDSLGLTPASRTRVAVPEKKRGKTLAEILEPNADGSYDSEDGDN